MKVYLACLCGDRDERPTPDHEPVICPTCGDRMRAYQPPAWILDRQSAPTKEGNQHG